jgi:predicted small secreted protein
VLKRGAGAGLVAAVVVVAIVLAGCDAITGAARGAPEGPQPCGQRFNAVRCLAMTDTAALRLHTTREDIVAIDVVPDPTPVTRDGVTIIETTSGGKPIDLRVTLADGSIRQATMFCVGVNQEPACVDDPHIDTHSISLDGGYHDTTADATRVPSTAPDAIADAAGLRIDRLDIPIDHSGRHEVRLGEAWLPNGLVTTADFALVDDWPPGVTILEGGASLEIRSRRDGKPIQNIYEHGWRSGIEGVDVVLVFDVFRFDPGATLSIKDVVVR